MEVMARGEGSFRGVEEEEAGGASMGVLEVEAGEATSSAAAEAPHLLAGAAPGLEPIGE